MAIRSPEQFFLLYLPPAFWLLARLLSASSLPSWLAREGAALPPVWRPISTNSGIVRPRRAVRSPVARFLLDEGGTITIDWLPQNPPPTSTRPFTTGGAKYTDFPKRFTNQEKNMVKKRPGR